MVERKGERVYSLQLRSDAKRRQRAVLFAPSLPLANSVKNGVSKVDARLAALDYSDFSGKDLHASATYVLKKPGKMLRPALVLLGAKLVGADTDEFVDMAAAAELLHAASLVHDDIVDKDTMRRGEPALHTVYGQETALLAGDALIAKSVSMAAKYGPRVVRRVAEASLDMCAGELLDYTAQKEGRMLGVREYLRIARLKSGIFMGICASMAATYKRDRKKADALYGLGLNLGMAFQIRDDIIEFADSGEKKRNGGSRGATSLNLVSVFMRQFGVSESEALERAVGLNNYFADRAMRFVQGEKEKGELASYIDFVRVKNR